MPSAPEVEVLFAQLPTAVGVVVFAIYVPTVAVGSQSVVAVAAFAAALSAETTSVADVEAQSAVVVETSIVAFAAAAGTPNGDRRN